MSTETERDLRQEWETPEDFFGVVDAEFDFQIDVCATAENTKCDDYIGPKGDQGALMIDAKYPATPWLPSNIRRAWCNPGFSDPFPWMERAYKEAQAHCDAVIVVMSRISPSTKWWRNWAMKALEIRLLTGSARSKSRVHFVPPPGVKASSNTQENCLIIFRPNPHELLPRIWTWDWTKGLP